MILVRVSKMRLSLDDEGSFKESQAVGSLKFNNPQNDSNDSELLVS
jgi:hypothetical protein